MLGLGVVTGLLLGCAGWGVARIVRAIADRRPATPTPLLYGLAAALVAIPIGIQLFAGQGIQRSVVGTIGPWLFPPAVLGASVPAFALLLSASRQRGTRLWSGTVATCLALTLIALAADRHVLVGLYDWLHVMAVLCAIALLGLGVGLLLPERLPRWAGLGALAVALAAPMVLADFPESPAARTFLAERHSSARRLLQAIRWSVDLDGDGASPILQGGDCDDLDPEVGPRKAEIEGNGRDEDCDGLDYVKLEFLAPDQFGYAVDREMARSLSAQARGRPTVVLQLDALRLDRVGRPQFPNLARMDRESIRFTNAFAPSSGTKGSLPAMWVGHALPRWDETSVFGRLRDLDGIRSAFVTIDVYLDGLVPREYPPYVDLCVDKCGHRVHESFDDVISLPTKNDGRGSGWGRGVKTWTGTAVTDRALEALDGPTPPDVMWVSYFDLHQWAWIEDTRSQGFARYDEVLARLDREVGRWLERGDSINLIVSSDHGELLGRPNVSFHTSYLYVELVRVPILIRIPGARPATVTHPVALADLAPTLHDLIRPLSDDHAWARRSLLGTVGTRDPGNRPIPMYDAVHMGLVVGSRRFLYDVETRAGWLYDIYQDPEEKFDLAAIEPRLAEQMSAQMSQTYSWQRARQLKP